MINNDIGIKFCINGIDFILTDAGKSGHSIFGPYTSVATGFYKFAFSVSFFGDGSEIDDDVCAKIGIVSNWIQHFICSRIDDWYSSESQRQYNS